MQSRNKLQNKAETIEDQNDIGYSMNFDEDSMGQSQTIGVQNKNVVEVKEPMDEVKEEEESGIKESFNEIQSIQDSQNAYTESKPSDIV